MGRRWPEVVLFDVFGTLVTYEADRTAIVYERTHALLRERGMALTHDEFVATWDAASRHLESAGESSHVEHSMHDIAPVFLDAVALDLDPPSVDLLIDTFLAEWVAPVALVPGADLLVRDLSRRHRLGVVSNTNDPEMVPSLLARFEIADCFDHVVLSVDHGHRKPHPSIYGASLDLFGAAAADTVFVGDTFDADYVGPRSAGMTACLIDPDHVQDVPAEDRLDSLLDLADRLGGGEGT